MPKRCSASTLQKGQFGLPSSMHALPRGMTVAMIVAETERAGDHRRNQILSGRPVVRRRDCADAGRTVGAHRRQLADRRTAVDPMKRRRDPSACVADRRHGERGFALLEILVAFVILALGLGAISTGVAVAMRSDARTQTNRIALRVAQSRLEAAGIYRGACAGLSRRPDRGQITRWRQTVTAVRSRRRQRGRRRARKPGCRQLAP